MTPEERRRRVGARLRAEMTPEEVVHADEVPEWAHSIGMVLDDVVDDLKQGRDPRERPR